MQINKIIYIQSNVKLHSDLYFMATHARKRSASLKNCIHFDALRISTNAIYIFSVLLQKCMFAPLHMSQMKEKVDLCLGRVNIKNIERNRVYHILGM